MSLKIKKNDFTPPKKPEEPQSETNDESFILKQKIFELPEITLSIPLELINPNGTSTYLDNFKELINQKTQLTIQTNIEELKSKAVIKIKKNFKKRKNRITSYISCKKLTL